MKYLGCLAAVIASLLLALSVLSGSAQAAGVVFGDNQSCGGQAGGSVGCRNQGGANPVTEVLNRAINLAAVIGGIVGTIFVVVGGVRYVLSEGDPEKLKLARSTIIYALVGLLLIAVARAVVGFVLGKLNN